jgi:hypothetical protein
VNSSAHATARHTEWTGQILDLINDRPPARAYSAQPTLIGKAFEFAVGLDLLPHPYPGFFASLPAHDGQHVRGMAVHWQHARPDLAALEDLLRGSWYLAHCDILVTKLSDHGQQPDRPIKFVGEAFQHEGQLPQWEQALPELTELWSRHEQTVAPMMRAQVTAAAAPLEQRTGVHGPYGMSIVDFIAGDLLIELKTGHITSPWTCAPPPGS